MQLQPLLSEYLLETGTLPMAVSKQLSIEQKPAILKDSDSIVIPPSNNVVFSEIATTEQVQQNLIIFISSRLSISTEQTAELLGKEGNLESAFAATEAVNWPAIGRFQKQKESPISFEQTKAFTNYLPTILLKQNKPQSEVISHIEAPEPEVSNEAIYELQEPLQKDNWWVWAIVILVVSMALILFRFL